MKRWTIVICAASALASSGWAAERDTSAQYFLARETGVESAFRAQLGFGLLDGADGTPITNYFGVDFGLGGDFVASLGLPLGGTLSSGPDDYGIGNVVLGGRYVLPLDRLQVGLGLDVALPTAGAGSAVGVATRRYTLYVQDQTAFTPYVVVSYVLDRLTLMADFGADLQLFTETSPGTDRMEAAIVYDAALAHAFWGDFWATVEFGGYSTLTFGGANETELFAGPGLRYQDHELSAGLHLTAPFRSPAKDIIDFQLALDFRVRF